MSLKNNTQSLQEVLEILSTKASGGEQATPEILINSSTGEITATAGLKTTTYQMAFQAAKTITPSTVTQVAISSGHYAGGSVTVAAVPTQSKSVTPTSSAQNIMPDSGKFLSKVTVNGDSNLIASNIKSGVSIFGVNGTLQEGGGSGKASEWSENEDAMITGTLSAYSNDRVKSINSYAFYSRSNLVSVNFPACTLIGSNAFTFCYSLTSVDFPTVTLIGTYAFGYCYHLSSFQLGASSICTLTRSNAFDSTPFAGYSSYFSGTPHIYVPASLVSAYQSATNWTYFSSYFSAIETSDSGTPDQEVPPSGTHDFIEFTINGVGYCAISGMTWVSWCNSDYNTGGYIADISGNLVFNAEYTEAISEDGRNPVDPAELVKVVAYTTI